MPYHIVKWLRETSTCQTTVIIFYDYREYCRSLRFPTLQVPPPYIYGAPQTSSSLFLLMSWHLTVLGHQQEQCWLQSCICFLLTFFGCRWSRIPFVGPMTSFKMADEISWNFTALRMRDTEINSSPHSAAYMRQGTGSILVRKWIVAWSSPSHYLNQWWLIVNWILGNKFRWNSNKNT